MGKAGFVSIAARGEQPVDIIADEMAALFDAAVIGVCCEVDGLDLGGFGVGEELDHVSMKNRSIGLEGEQIVAPARHDTIRAAIPVWVPMASMVTSAPFSSRRCRSAGMAWISLDFSSIASWPRTRRCLAAQALTMCNGARPLERAWARREILPSIATMSGSLSRRLSTQRESTPEKARDRAR